MNSDSSNRFQSEQLREVRSHLTEAEKQLLKRWMTRFGIWMLLLASIGSSTAALHGILAIILVVVWAVLFLGSFIFGMTSLSKFYCSTDWGKKHGYSHKTFRFFELPLRK
jgi:hypothetical protein